MSENQKDPYTVEVGRRLAAARRATSSPRITQARAAEMLAGITGKEFTAQAVANYEQGTRLPSPPVVDALCRIYGNVTASYILGLADAPQSMREQSLLAKYRMADDRGKYSIDRIAEFESAEVADDESKGPDQGVA